MIRSIFRRVRSLTITDYIVLLCLFVLIGYGSVYFSTKTQFMYIEMIPQNNEWTVTEHMMFHETDTIKIGDSVYSSFGSRVAEVTDVSTVNYGGRDRFIKVIVKIKAKYNPRTKIYSYNDSPILIGNLLTLSLGQVSFKGRILYIYDKPENKYKNFQFRNVLATVLFRGVESSHADAMKTFEMKNSQGKLLAKAVEAEIYPQEYDVTTDKGEVLRRSSTIYKDVILKLLLPSVTCSRDTCFFNDIIDLKVGIKYFWAHSNTTFLPNGIITDLEYLDGSPSALPQN